MKFCKKYPNAKDQDEFKFEGDTLIFFKDERKCFHCNSWTNFASLGFESWFCSEECNRHVWEDFGKALKRLDK